MTFTIHLILQLEIPLYLQKISLIREKKIAPTEVLFFPVRKAEFLSKIGTGNINCLLPITNFPLLSPNAIAKLPSELSMV